MRFETVWMVLNKRATIPVLRYQKSLGCPGRILLLMLLMRELSAAVARTLLLLTAATVTAALLFSGTSAGLWNGTGLIVRFVISFAIALGLGGDTQCVGMREPHDQ